MEALTCCEIFAGTVNWKRINYKCFTLFAHVCFYNRI